MSVKSMDGGGGQTWTEREREKGEAYTLRRASYKRLGSGVEIRKNNLSMYCMYV